MCEFHGSNGNGFGDIWWTDNPIYFSSIDMAARDLLGGLFLLGGTRVPTEVVYSRHGRTSVL